MATAEQRQAMDDARHEAAVLLTVLMEVQRFARTLADARTPETASETWEELYHLDHVKNKAYEGTVLYIALSSLAEAIERVRSEWSV